MTLGKVFLAAAVVLSLPVLPALAHDDENYGYNSHDRFHDQLSGAHERAHEYGFTVVASIVPIIAPFGISMTMAMDIRDPTIRGLSITAPATIIGVGSLRPDNRAVEILLTDLFTGRELKCRGIR